MNAKTFQLAQELADAINRHLWRKWNKAGRPGPDPGLTPIRAVGELEFQRNGVMFSVHDVIAMWET